MLRDYTKTITLLMLLLYASGAYPGSSDEQITTETHASLWLTFQTTDRLPTSRTAKKMTAEGLQSCKTWRLHAQKNFPAQISQLFDCEDSDGVCASKGVCTSYWATNVTFKTPLTLINRTRSFAGSKSKQSMEACLKWTHEVAKQEGARSFWSTCSYEDQSDENEPVTGQVESLLDLSSEPKNRLLRHYRTQARMVKFKQRKTSNTDARFPFKLRKSRAEVSDPEFKSSLTDCDSWRTRSLNKFTAQSTGIEACKLSSSICQLSDPPTCHFSHIARISWKVPRTIYTIERKFPSPDTTAQGFDACLGWLKDEQEFAPAETIDAKCSISGSETSGGKTIHSIMGSINQIDLE